MVALLFTAALNQLLIEVVATHQQANLVVLMQTRQCQLIANQILLGNVVQLTRYFT